MDSSNTFPSDLASGTPIVRIPTAVPAFIGYTPQASRNGKSYVGVPVKIASLNDFLEVFGYPSGSSLADPVKQYNPQYYLVRQTAQPSKGKDVMVFGNYYSILPDASSIYYTYNSVRLFFENGGGAAYIVSAGSYGAPSGKPISLGGKLINPNIRLDDLVRCLLSLKRELEPTLYICPDATLLPDQENAKLMQQMLQQCQEMQTAMSIFDVPCGLDPDPKLFMNDIVAFRDNIADTGRMYGAAYFPFVGTNIVKDAEIDYTNLFGGDLAQLAAIINPPDYADKIVAAIFADMQNPASGKKVSENNTALVNASSSYSSIMQPLRMMMNLLPPSGAMAGVMATVDAQNGVWQAPANVTITGSSFLPISLTDDQQGPLNVPVDGKAINVIRYFPGQGILVWGARTFDGNSNDYRYINTSRTSTFIVQSCTQWMSAITFLPNNAKTWAMVSAAINKFLNGLWLDGCLFGSKPGDAYSVLCGLGTTMTGEDIENKLLRVQIKFQFPSIGFLVVTIEHKMSS